MNHRFLLMTLPLSLLSLFTLSCSQSQSELKTIYNIDSRAAVDALTAPELLTFVDSVAIIVQTFRIKMSEQGTSVITSNSAGNILGLCIEEKFRDDLMLGECSGFLISDQLLVTAGHCIKTDSDCSQKSFIFGHTSSQQAEFSTSEIYKCSRVVNRLQKDLGDLVLVELDRPVISREGTRRFKAPELEDPLSEKYSKLSEIVSMGHPLGTRMKAAPLEKLFTPDSDHFFRAHLDVAQGASGSPLFNQTTGVVHGVLVGGSNDFTWDKKANCARSHICTDDSCEGEVFASSLSIGNLLRHSASR